MASGTATAKAKTLLGFRWRRTARHAWLYAFSPQVAAWRLLRVKRHRPRGCTALADAAKSMPRSARANIREFEDFRGGRSDDKTQ